MAREMFNRNHQTVSISEDEECQLYTLMCVKSVFMLKKFIEKFGDEGRKLLIDVINFQKFLMIANTFQMIHYIFR